MQNSFENDVAAEFLVTDSGIAHFFLVEFLGLLGAGFVKIINR